MSGLAPATVFDDGVASGVMPPPALAVSEWADANLVLAGKAASEPGPFRVMRTPYAREPMDCMAVGSPVEEVVLIWGAQTGKSTVANACLGYWVDIEPAPTMFVQPTLNLAKRYSQQRIASMIDSTPVLKAKFAGNRSRDGAATTLMKDFRGGVLVVGGANSAADLRSMPVRYLLLDECDAYPQDVDGEGDPCDLAQARQSTFARKKRLKTSTPADELTSRIEPWFRESSRGRYHVPCPHCDHLQPLKWENLRWPEGEPDRAHYVCENCGSCIEEHSKAAMLPEEGRGGRARWVHEDPAARVRGYHLSSLYSPLGWVSWAQLAREFIEAKRAADQGDVTKLKTFVNVRLAETWKQSGEERSAHELAARAEAYQLGTVPAGVLLLTAGVDVQGNRIEMAVKGWGRGEESWLIDHLVLYGEPADLLSGADSRLLEAERQVYRAANGAEMRISAIAIDSGGHHTADVYLHCRNARLRHVFAVKGQSQPNKPILGKPSDVEVNWRGARIKRGAQVWPVGSDTAKELIYGRLRVTRAGPGCMHFPANAPDDYYAQLTAEKLVTKWHKGRQRREWVLPKGRRNEALDLEVYAIAAAAYAGVQRMRDGQWAALERQFGAAESLPAGGAPPSAGPGASPPPAGGPVPPAPVRPRLAPRGGFVNRWR